MKKKERLIAISENAYPYPLLIPQLLHTPILYQPDQEIVYRDSGRFTYRQFYSRLKRLASGLQAIGVKPGQVVAFVDWDSHRYLEAYFAVPGIGAVLHCVNPRLSPDQVAYTMSHAEDRVVLVHEDFLPLMAGIKDKLPSVKRWILIKETDRPAAADLSVDFEYEELLDRGTEDYSFPDFDENTMATLFYTTGTTGNPKGVYYSHRQLVLHTLGMAVAVGGLSSKGIFRSGDVYMPITPMFHVHAWGIPYIATVLGVKQVFPGRYEPGMLLSLLAKEKVTFSHCVPTILQMLVSSPAVKNVNLSGWKVIIGGSALPKGLARSAMELGIDIYTGYGMSETGPVLTLANLKPGLPDSDLEAQLDIRTATGRPIPLVDLRIVGGDMKELPHDRKSTGEIVVRAPWLTQGYFKDAEQSQSLWEGGYLHTGDVAHMDADGYVRITDRIKDVIKTGGEWVSSLELEDLISRHQAVREVAVVGVPDAKWGERPLAVVVPSAPEKPFPQESLKDFLAGFVAEGRLSKYAVPDRFVVSDQIPKTSVGKIDKKLIRRQLAASPQKGRKK